MLGIFLRLLPFLLYVAYFCWPHEYVFQGPTFVHRANVERYYEPMAYSASVEPLQSSRFVEVYSAELLQYEIAAQEQRNQFLMAYIKTTHQYMTVQDLIFHHDRNDLPPSLEPEFIRYHMRQAILREYAKIEERINEAMNE